MNLSKLLFLPVLTAALSGPWLSLHAATTTWDGGGPNAQWSWPSNWSNDQVPNSTRDVVLGSAFGSGKTITITGSHQANSLVFSNATNVKLVAPSFAGLGGNTLNLSTGDIRVHSGNPVTVGCRLNLVTAGIFDVGYGQKLDIQGPIIGAVYTNVYYIPYAGLHKDGDGELILGGTNTFSGAVFVEEGRLTVARSNALPHTLLYVAGSTLDPSELHLKDNVTPNLSYVLLQGETLVTGGAGSRLHADNFQFRDLADVDVVLAGTGGVFIADGATPILRRVNTFTGDIVFGHGSVLTADRDGSLGATGNTLDFQKSAELVVEGNNGLTSGGRTIHVGETGSAQLTLENNLNCRLSGPGTVVITIEGSSTLELGGDNSAFTGSLFSNKHLEVTDWRAFGGAALVFLEAGRDITFFEDIEAPTTDLKTSSTSSHGTVITLNNHDVTLDKLLVGQNSADGNADDTVIQLSTGVGNGVLHLNDIEFLGTGRLRIEGWMGNTTSASGDRVEVASVLSNSEIDRIRINGLPARRFNGQLVYAP